MVIQRLNDVQLNSTVAVSLSACVLLMTLAKFGYGAYAGIFGIISLVPCALAFVEKSDRRFQKEWAASLKAALDSIDMVQDGKHWMAAESEVVYISDPEPVPESVRLMKVPIVCKTKRGTWFMYYVIMRRAKVVSTKLEELTTEGAAEIVRREPEIYAAYFGRAEIA